MRTARLVKIGGGGLGQTPPDHATRFSALRDEFATIGIMLPPVPWVDPFKKPLVYCRSGGV